jgi:hypothetical protein
MLVRDVLAEWIEDRSIDYAPTTVGWYRSISRYLEPIADVDVESLTGPQVNAVWRAMLGQGQSRATVRRAWKTLSAALASAGQVSGVRVPGADKRTGRHGVWTAAQAAQFLAHVAGDPLAAGRALAVVGGLRRGAAGGRGGGPGALGQPVARR